MRHELAGVGWVASGRNACGGRRAPADATRNSGFTLIELLTVMAIMMIIAGIAVASYFAMTRGTAGRSAVAHLRSTLLLARQAAVMNGHRTYVLFDEGGVVPSYAVCMEDGRVTRKGSFTGVAGTWISDTYADWSDLPVGAVIYNLTGYESFAITAVTNHSTHGWLLATANMNQWHTDDRYGWEIMPRVMFPRGYALIPPEDDVVIFKPDGTVPHATYDLEIGVEELVGTNYQAKVVVKKLTGFVTVPD